MRRLAVLVGFVAGLAAAAVIDALLYRLDPASEWRWRWEWFQ